TNHFYGGNTGYDQLRQLALSLCGCTKTKTALARCYDCFYNGWIAVPQDHRSPRLHIIQITIPINVIEIRALRVINENRVASNSFEGAYRAIYASREQGLCLCKQFMGT